MPIRGRFFIIAMSAMTTVYYYIRTDGCLIKCIHRNKGWRNPKKYKGIKIANTLKAKQWNMRLQIKKERRPRVRER